MKKEYTKKDLEYAIDKALHYGNSKLDELDGEIKALETMRKSIEKRLEKLYIEKEHIMSERNNEFVYNLLGEFKENEDGESGIKS